MASLLQWVRPARALHSTPSRFHMTRIRQARVMFSSEAEPEPILDRERLQQRLQSLAPAIASSLSSIGYWTNDPADEDTQIVSNEEVRVMRMQSIALRDEGRFEQSWSESTSSATGVTTRFDKEGVFACEPDGEDYYTAPDMLMYMSIMIGWLPPLLNNAFNAGQVDDILSLSGRLQLSNQAFNAKLAVTSPGGSVYPLHVDNTLGVTGSPNDDTRKLTCILYLNPDHDVDHGGELRLIMPNEEIVDLDPSGGRIVMFWSDEIPHEVLPCAPNKNKDDADYDRYALTLWIPDLDPRNIQPPGSKFESLRSFVFDSKTN